MHPEDRTKMIAKKVHQRLGILLASIRSGKRSDTHENDCLFWRGGNEVQMEKMRLFSGMITKTLPVQILGGLGGEVKV